jgi:endonuclease-3
MKSPAEARRIAALLMEHHPNADTELHYRNPFELLVATILSAQSTDRRVNQVTPQVFGEYPDARALAVARVARLEALIHSTGFFRAKAKSLIGMARAIVDRHDGKVPANLAALVELPGVGRKTANVVLGHAFKIPGLPVDRHVLRVANRIGLADSAAPEEVERQLCAVLPETEWTRVSDALILHGRRICKPTPRCDVCLLSGDCRYVAATSDEAHPPAGAGPARARARQSRTTGARPRVASRHQGNRQGEGSDGADAHPSPAPAATPSAAKRRTQPTRESTRFRTGRR